MREALAPDGTWLIVEPYAATPSSRNLNPVGRVYYGFSTYLCVPNALSQHGGHALGAQAGEAAIREVVTAAGFTRFRRAAETPFNIVLEAGLGACANRVTGRSEARVERSETRMMIDCRTVPSESRCTVALAGEPDELLDLAARHAVDVHGHVDGPELRDALRAAMAPAWEPPTAPGAFVQVVEFTTDRIEEWGPIQDRLVKALGPTGRCAGRCSPRTATGPAPTSLSSSSPPTSRRWPTRATRRRTPGSPSSPRCARELRRSATSTSHGYGPTDRVTPAERPEPRTGASARPLSAQPRKQGRCEASHETGAEAGAAPHHPGHDLLEHGGVVDVAAGQQHRQGSTMAVAGQVDLGGGAAAGPPL